MSYTENFSVALREGQYFQYCDDSCNTNYILSIWEKTVKLSLISTVCATVLIVPVVSNATDNKRALEVRTTQEQITSGELSLKEIRFRGMKLFSTPFTKADGFGETPGITAEARRKNGSRGSLQGNGTFTRINGLDAQTCLECHSVVSRATIPMKFGIGGVGGVNNTVLGGGGASFINANDDALQINDPDGFGTTGAQNINGRTINPPFIFGSGGVELVGNEMTLELQALKQQALNNPGTVVDLITKDINFGTLSADAGGNFDVSGVDGIDSDPESDTFLVVQPFGRKGNNITTRTFDLDAMQFHSGMQPVEIVGPGVDADNDGVIDELLVGELSALNVFSAALERPFQSKMKHKARQGKRLFNEAGCTECHVPVMKTNSRKVGMRFPEIAQNPSANVYLEVDLSKKPTKFKKNRQGGVDVQMFADLKRHDMGPELAEFNGSSSFTTARLWGVADTAPYLHDGRALTIDDAIVLHGKSGSEAETAVSYYNNDMTGDEKNAVLAYLGTLRTPKNPAKDLVKLANKRKHQDDDD